MTDITPCPLVTYVGDFQGGTPEGTLLATFAALDPMPDADFYTYTATIDWGDGITTEGYVTPASTRMTDSGKYDVVFNVKAVISHSYSGNSYFEPGGVYPVTITTHNSKGYPTDVITTAAQVNSHQPVVVSATPIPTAPAAGQATTLNVSFGDGPDWTYERAVHVYWGDGSEEYVYLPNAQRTAAVQHTYATAGDFIVRTIVERQDRLGHSGESSPTDYDTVTVTAAPQVGISGLPATSPEGSAVTLGATGSIYTGSETLAWSVTKDGVAYGTAGTGTGYTFAPDDNASYAVSLLVTSADGTSRLATGTVTVTDVAPTLTLSGANAIAEGALYTLNLATSDPGADAISSWNINWGDGSAIQTVAGTTTVLTHTYANGPASCTISATATDEDGIHTAGNTVAVTINNVAPTVTINGLPGAPRYESTVIDLTSAVTDPGMGGYSDLCLERDQKRRCLRRHRHGHELLVHPQ